MSTRAKLSTVTLIAWFVVVLLATSALAQAATVTFLHVNDVYEISPVQGRGGFAPLMTLLRRERAAAPDAITTLGGDLIALGEGEELTQQSFRALGLGAAHAEGPATATNVHVQTRLQQTQVLIQRPAQIRKPRIVRWTECEFPLRFGR